MSSLSREINGWSTNASGYLLYSKICSSSIYLEATVNMWSLHYNVYIKLLKNPLVTWFCTLTVSQFNIFWVTYWIINKTDYIWMYMSIEDIKAITFSMFFALRLYYHGLHKFISQMDLGFPCFYNIGKVQRRVFVSFFLIFCSATTPRKIYNISSMIIEC